MTVPTRPVWPRFAVLAPVVVLVALFLGPQRWRDRLGPLMAAPPNQRPPGFTINDPLDPSMKTGYRHPFTTGYIAPYDRLFPTSDPVLAPYAHEEYSLELDRSDTDPALGWASVRVPDGVAAAGEAALRPAACRLFRGIVAEPNHAGYQRLLVELHADGPPVRFDLARQACGT